MSPALLADRLNEAAHTGTPITILYRDADRETTHRILPLAASNRVLRARDLASNQARVFLLTQLEILEEIDDAPAAAKALPSPTPPPGEVLASLVDELKSLGWHVSVSSDRISVHPSHPDGKPMKTAAAYIARNSETKANTLSRRRRPWTVVAVGIAKARSFVTLDAAVGLFMTQVRLYAPSLRRQRSGSTSGR